MTPKERKHQVDKERKTRNEAIYSDSEGGMTKEELSKKYGLKPDHLWKILKETGIRADHAQGMGLVALSAKYKMAAGRIGKLLSRDTSEEWQEFNNDGEVSNE